MMPGGFFCEQEKKLKNFNITFGVTEITFIMLGITFIMLGITFISLGQQKQHGPTC